MPKRYIDFPEEGSFKGLIFDLDGTLLDSMPAHYQAWTKALDEQGAPGVFSEELFYAMGGRPTTDIINALNEANGLTLDAEKVSLIKDEFFESRLKGIPPIPEVADFAAAHRGKVPMAVASGGTIEIVTESLKDVDMFEWFDAVVGSDQVAEGKPAPDVFLEAAKRMGIDPKDCIVFEDGPAGIEAAEAAEMRVVIIPQNPSVDGNS